MSRGTTVRSWRVTVLGGAVEGLAVEFSRAVSGRRASYAWNAVTDANGQASLVISSTGRVSGYYRARALDARRPGRRPVEQHSPQSEQTPVPGTGAGGRREDRTCRIMCRSQGRGIGRWAGNQRAQPL